MKKIKTQGNIIPVELDTESSSTTTYINKNIEQKEYHKYEEDEPTQTYYEYDQYVFSKEEYSMYLEDKELTSEQRTSKIAELEAYLASTDWYASRLAETGVKVPKDIKENRRKARLEISLLRDLENIGIN